MYKFIICIVLFMLLTLPGFCDEIQDVEYSSFGINENRLLEFADFLFFDGDFFRAISVYKAIYFYSQDDDMKTYCILRIAKAYLKSNKYKSSIRYAGILANDDNALATVKTESFLLLGLNYYSLQNYQLASQFFTMADELQPFDQGLLYLGLIEAETRNWEGASEVFSTLARNNDNKQLTDLAHNLSLEVLKGKKIKRVSPVFSVFLSTLIPGAGQLYSGHFYDALQAFLYVGIFGLASYGVYLYDSHFSDHYVYTIAMVSITGLLHLSNIISAYRTAQYRNHRVENQFLDNIRSMVFTDY